MEPYEYVDVAQIRRLEDCKGIIVGRLSEDDTSECVDFNPQRINSHMYVVAMSGSGKTYGFVKPYIFQSVKRRHSLVMTDPKGELYHDMAGYLQDNGYIVRRLDFKNLEKSDGWDCLRSLRGKGMRTKVQIFSNAAISNISPNDHSIFSTGSDSLLQALHYRAETVYAYTAEGDCGTDCNYRGLELFPCKASSIYCHCEKEEFGIVLMERYLELWMLEDFSFALVASTETDYEDGEYSTAYRVIRSTDLGEIAQEMKLDLERIAAQLIRLADSYGMSGMPTYEL